MMKSPKTIKEKVKKIFSRRAGMAPAKHGHIGKMEFRDGVTIVRLQGNITFDTLHGIRHEHEQRFKGIKVKNIIADFKNISEIDTAAIVALVDRLKEMRSEYSKGAIGLINLPPKLRTLLEISKTKELFAEYGSEEEALVSLA